MHPQRSFLIYMKFRIIEYFAGHIYSDIYVNPRELLGGLFSRDNQQPSFYHIEEGSTTIERVSYVEIYKRVTE